MSELLYRIIVVVGWVTLGAIYNQDSLGSPVVWACLAAAAVGAYIIAVNLPAFIETKRAEVEALMEGFGLR